MVTKEQITEALKKVKHPKLQRSYVDLGMVKNILIEKDTVTLTVALKNERSPLQKRIKQEMEAALLPLADVGSVKFEFTVLSPEERDRLFPKPQMKGIENVGHIVAVASGKGGVGKTTVAVNLALSLAREGYRTGLLDADVYGPSIPVMLGLTGELATDTDIVNPVEKFGIRIMSLGMAVRQGDAIIWRGPLVSKMIHNMLSLVQWGELDYLIIDLPPGTGDPSITIAQSLPRCVILMVTTPQEVSLSDVRRAVGLFRKTGQGIVGLIENMSYFVCSQSVQPIELFGHGGGEKLSRETDIPLLANIPFDVEIRQGGDAGVPFVTGTQDTEARQIFQKLARKLTEKMTV